MQKFLAIDATKCTGCRICEMVCSVKKEGVVNPSRARIQIIKWELVSFDMPMVCQQCQDAPCATVCPVNALSRDVASGIVNHNEDICIGCKSCVAVCPFGAMGIDIKKDKVIKCDLCQGDPTCVKFCDTGAIQYVTATSLNFKKRREAAERFSDLIHKYTTMTSK